MTTYFARQAENEAIHSVDRTETLAQISAAKCNRVGPMKKHCLVASELSRHRTRHAQARMKPRFERWCKDCKAVTSADQTAAEVPPVWGLFRNSMGGRMDQGVRL
jgi:hypothetical protein